MRHGPWPLGAQSVSETVRHAGSCATSPVKPPREPRGVRQVLGGGGSQLNQAGMNQPVEALGGVGGPGVGISGRKQRVPREEVENGAQRGSTTRCSPKGQESMSHTDTRP